MKKPDLSWSGSPWVSVNSLRGGKWQQRRPPREERLLNESDRSVGFRHDLVVELRPDRPWVGPVFEPDRADLFVIGRALPLHRGVARSQGRRPCAPPVGAAVVDPQLPDAI